MFRCFTKRNETKRNESNLQTKGMRNRFKGNEYHEENGKIVMTFEDVTPYLETMMFLETQSPIGPLEPN